MKVVIFTPGLRASAIGRMTALVTKALAEQKHDVVVVRCEDYSLIEGVSHDFGENVAIYPWTASVVSDLLEDADVVVYQIGNEYSYHRGCIEWMTRVPGVVCLHDFFLGNLFYGWAEGRREHAMGVLRHWYGETVALGYFTHNSSESFIEGTKDCAPMTEWICSQALSVIAHSRWGIQRVMESCPGPVKIVPLAYDAPGAGNVSDAENAAEDPFVLLTIGHVNPNKRVESVIRAIARNAFLRSFAQYRVVGRIEHDMQERLRALAEDQQVNLVILGEVPSNALAQEISRADAICCLRWPTIEGASASAIEAMLYGKAVIVTDAGFYAELPDECVRKIGVPTEIEDLEQVLESLASDPVQRGNLGKNAAVWAGATFSHENYASQIVEMGFSTQRAALIMDTMNKFVELLSNWGQVQALMSLPRTLKPLEIFNTPSRPQ